jgi:phage tail sheath protein FI
LRLPTGAEDETAELAGSSVKLLTKAKAPTLSVTAKEPGEAVEVTVSPSSEEGATEDQFDVAIEVGDQTETFTGLTFSKAKGAKAAVETINAESKLVMVEDLGAPGKVVEKAPAMGTYTVDVPVTTALMGNRVAILDSPPGLNPQKVAKWRKDDAGYDSKYAALYYPWIEVVDMEGKPFMLPPSGHVAGLYSRVDSERGVHKAPANEIVRGALGLETQVTRGEQDLLNDAGRARSAEPDGSQLHSPISRPGHPGVGRALAVK